MTNQSIANVVATLLNEINVDGETMENIINQSGMRDQMVKQLITDKEEPEELIVVISFTKEELIEYTRAIQERFKTAAVESINNAGIDFEDMVELELDYNKTIEVNFDDHSLYKEIESAIDDAFETDDESIYDEATYVMLHVMVKG